MSSSNTGTADPKLMIKVTRISGSLTRPGDYRSEDSQASYQNSDVIWHLEIVSLTEKISPFKDVYGTVWIIRREELISKNRNKTRLCETDLRWQVKNQRYL